ncbi:titin homolog isoform X2 [Micropterus salmoides]|uniref:titin homolog isoform X2 n=1 Tax=Micropterus salmoides TaxID=27706 RepID=UPI0018ED6873|nr:titin homolog isoform X2 [Micropterus salmoides]
MKLLLSGLFFTSLSLSVSSGTLVVTQSPDVSVMEGERVNITCCGTGGSRMRISWLKNQTEIKTETFESKNYSQRSLRKESSGCSDLIFTNIKREDAGRYTCRMTVEIPLLKEAEGNGTFITVTDRDRSKINPAADRDTTKINSAGVADRDVTIINTSGDSHRKEVFMFALRCLPILALVITFFYLYKLGSRAQQHIPDDPGNKVISAQRMEEDQEEEETDERETEAESR